MSKSKALSWNDRFALIDHFQPDDKKACEVFDVTQDELDAARSMRDAKSFTATEDLDVDAYGSWFDSGDGSQNQASGKSKNTATSQKASTSKSTAKSGKSSSKTSTTTSKKSGGKQKTATKKSTATSTKRPGRRGSKIATAFEAIPTTPTPAEQFAQSNNVSLAVLRQSKRFDRYPEKGAVRVKKDKDKGELMIWREADSSN